MKKLVMTLAILCLCLFSLPTDSVDAATKLSKKSVTLYVGKTTKLKVTGTKKKVTWKSSNKKVATVKNGTVTAKKSGSTKITAKVGSKSYTCKVTVKNQSLTKKTLALNTGESYTLKLNGAYKKVTWSSSNPAVASVKNGKITALSQGTTTIKAKHNKKTYSCKVTVTQVFDSNAAANNLSYTLHNINTGVIAIIKNNNNYTVSMQADMVFYDANNNIIGTSSDDNYCFTSNIENALFFSAPHDENYNIIPYDHYSISFNVESADRRINNYNNIQLSHNRTENKVYVTGTNTSANAISFTHVSVIFYKNGVPVAYDYSYLNCTQPGSTGTSELDAFDSNYNYIDYDNYVLYYNYSFDFF